MLHVHHGRRARAVNLIIDDTDEDMTQFLTVVCDRSYRPDLLDSSEFGGAS